MTTRRRICGVGVVVVALMSSTILTGCATYMAAGKTFRHYNAKLVVALPAGWLRYTPDRSTFVMTRDGLRLESIAIASQRVGKRIAGTERAYSASMLPHEIAELSLGLLAARGDTPNFEVDKIALASVAGQDAYVADAHFIDVTGVPRRVRQYGARVGEYILEFRFVGSEPVYFEKHLPVFESMVASAHLN